MCETLGMTYAEFQTRVSSTEIELWMAEYTIRGNECPFCGIEPRDMEDFSIHEIPCPVCKEKYKKVRRSEPWLSSVHRTH